MRRRQMFSMSVETRTVVSVESPIISQSVVIEKPEEKKSYKAGKCPNCGKYISKGMYFHLKGCHDNV